MSNLQSIVFRFIALSLFLLVAGGATSAGNIDPDLRGIMETTPANQPLSVLVFLNDQLDIKSLSNDLNNQRATLDHRHDVVVRGLQQKANSTQQDLAGYLNNLKAAGSIDDYHTFWVTNAMEVKLTPSQIGAIASREDVGTVYFNYEIESIVPVDVTSGGPGAGAAAEAGLTAIRAPEVWAMGITGAGVLVSNIDTGVEGDHPALASRWAGVADPRYAGHPEWAWYDPYLGINDFPYDNNGHGTHTMGTICGGSPGNEVGVAPGALWIAAGAIDRGGGIARTVADAILSFEWMLDPDGNPSTTWDVPDVCSNSWGLVTGHGYPPCDETFWSYIDNCEAAGIVVIWAAGNEGTSGLRRPGDRATTDYQNCAVAAVDGNNPSWPIASFSSRGPTYCTPGGEAAIKPDVAAPGVSVRSAYPGGGYAYMSGTSMACPHIAGVVALIREANPNLTPDEVKQIMYETAYDLGSAGEDNSYGWGMVDAYEAVMLALADTSGITAEFSGTPTSGCAPLTVNFTDLSTGEITSWDWTFGDGGTSTDQDPVYTYNNAGNYTVSLTATGPSGSDVETKVDYITVLDVPVADFSGTPTSGDAPLTVNFTDLSTGNPTGWDWVFGDGGSSTDQDPAYTYTTAGIYTVSLTASNACGSDQTTKVDYITVTEPQVFEMHVSDIMVIRTQTAAPKPSKWQGVAEVTVVDAGGQPVANAQVTGFFNAPNTRPLTGTTGANGIAVITSKSTNKTPADWCFEVTNVTHSTYTYDAASNDVTRACESGWVFRATLPLPVHFNLEQNHPNPFNPKTSISFSIPYATDATLTIYNIMGQEVEVLVSGNLEAGRHTFDWYSGDAASGIYFYRLEADDFADTKKMILLK
jgi:PKD repeat protein